MKINYPVKKKETYPVKEKETYPVKEKETYGDLIKFDDGAIGLVLHYDKIVLLKYSCDDDWFKLETGSGYINDIKEGKYKIIAKANKWEINILK